MNKTVAISFRVKQKQHINFKKFKYKMELIWEGHSYKYNSKFESCITFIKKTSMQICV